VADVSDDVLKVQSSQDNCKAVDELIHWNQVLLLLFVKEFVCITKCRNVSTWMTYAQQHNADVKSVDV